MVEWLRNYQVITTRGFSEAREKGDEDILPLQYAKSLAIVKLVKIISAAAPPKAAAVVEVDEPLPPEPGEHDWEDDDESGIATDG